jgi:CRP-like cAMP-binding protein
MKKNCKNCLYGNLDSETLKISDKSHIFLEGQPIEYVYSIQEGYVKMSKYMENGDEFIIGVLGPGDYIGLLALLQGKRAYIASASTLSMVVIKKLYQGDVKRAYESNPDFKDLCLNCALTRSNLFHHQMLVSANTDIKEKIIMILKNFSYKFGQIEEKKLVIQLPFSKTILANIINIRRETLSRYLSLLSQENILEVQKNTYYLHDVI